MALLQLVAPGAGDLRAADEAIQNGAAQEFTEIDANGPALWGRQMIFTMLRSGDTLNEIHFSCHVGAAPQGFRWKRCWPFFLIQNMKLKVGGQEFWRITSETLQMQALIHGTRTPAECLFDFDEVERTRRSQQPHEIFFQPLRLSDVIANAYCIPMICLAFHEVKVEIQLGSLADCLEPLEVMPPPLPEDAAANNLLQTCTLLGLYTDFNHDERRNLVQNQELSNSVTRHFDYASEVFHLGEERPLRILINQENNCSAAYIWVTDLHNKEIPRQVVRRLAVRMNGLHLRHDLTGLQARHGMSHLLPHPVIENNKSQNLYYLSYFPGRRNADGTEQGMNMSRYDSYNLELDFEQGVPAEMKVHVLHRSQNKMRFRHGMGGLLYHLPPTTIFLANRRAPHVQPIDPNVIHGAMAAVAFPGDRTSEEQLLALVFENPDKPIIIPEDEPQCMITYLDFQQGQLVEQCNQCHKVFTAEGIFNWLKTRARQQWKCVHCQGSYSAQTFVRGKAHLADVAIANAEDMLIPRNPQQAGGIVERILQAVGFQPEHAHDA